VDMVKMGLARCTNYHIYTVTQYKCKPILTLILIETYNNQSHL
jgi:hypothetical protein